MKKALFAFALAAAASLATAPAPATTFPTLTTIYVGAGVMDGTGTVLQVATAFTCSNVSGQSANIRVLILSDSGTVADVHTQSFPHGANITVGTSAINGIAMLSMGTGQVLNGTVNIESTESGVFCSAMILDTDTAGPNGVTLRLVRINGHPGAEE